MKLTLKSQDQPAQNSGIQWNFEHPPREAQKTVLGWLEEHERTDIKIAGIEAPTGCGKSPINASFLNTYGGAILVPTKQLQDQYTRDWDVPLLKGSGNYLCSRAPSTGTMLEKSCKINGGRKINQKDGAPPISCRQCQGCPYSAAKFAFTTARWGVTNYSCYFALALHDPSFEIQGKWLAMDEGHHLEKVLIEAAAVTVKGDVWRKAFKQLMPMPDDVTQAIEQCKKLVAQGKIVFSPEKERLEFTYIDELGSAISYAEGEVSVGEPWCLSVGKDEFVIKPLSPEKLLFLIGTKRIVLTSATLPRPGLLKSWDNSYARLEVKSDFPVINRPINYIPVGSMVKASLEASMPLMVKKISQILAHHPHEKGIIHCASFQLGKTIGTLLNNKRVLVHNSFNRDEILHRHHCDDSPTVIISPSMTEGIDLKDDLGRFNIIAKIPYPSLGDQWVKAKQAVDQEWYAWSTAKDVVQAVGRTTRTDTDYSSSYILDSAFGKFYDRWGYLFPSWFSEAIR